jgi:hypothetical protein
LASTDANERAFAAASLATHVSGAGGATHHVYAAKRLVRGLCSSRGGARQGFAAGLATTLAVTREDEVRASLRVLRGSVAHFALTRRSSLTLSSAAACILRAHPLCTGCFARGYALF